jgi:peroxiredoxin
MARRIRIVMLVSMLVSGLVVAGCSSGEEPATIVQPDNTAPDFQLQSLDGQMVTLSSLRGRPVMLNFWASWCRPCQAEMSFIQEAFEDEDWREQGLVILAVNLGESRSKAKEFMEDNGLSFVVLLDADQSLAEGYNIRGIPTTFFIDKNGIIKDMKIGAFANKAEIDWRLLNSITEGE